MSNHVFRFYSRFTFWNDAIQIFWHLFLIASSIHLSICPTSHHECVTNHSVILQMNCRHMVYPASTVLSPAQYSGSWYARVSIILPSTSLSCMSDQHVAPQVSLSPHQHIINCWGDRMPLNITLLFPDVPKYSFSPGFGPRRRPCLDVSFY